MFKLAVQSMLFLNNRGRKITCIVGTADSIYYSITNLFQRVLLCIITSIKMAMNNEYTEKCNILYPSYESKLTAYKIRGGRYDREMKLVPEVLTVCF